MNAQASGASWNQGTSAGDSASLSACHSCGPHSAGGVPLLCGAPCRAQGTPLPGRFRFYAVTRVASCPGVLRVLFLFSLARCWARGGVPGRLHGRRREKWYLRHESAHFGNTHASTSVLQGKGEPCAERPCDRAKESHAQRASLCDDNLPKPEPVLLSLTLIEQQQQSLPSSRS